MYNNLAIIRAKRNFSQSKLADRVGVTPLTLGRWERGEALPREYNLKILCEVLECNEEDLGFSKGLLALTVIDTPQKLTAPLYDIAIPFAPKHSLVGREHDLMRIKTALWETDSGVVWIALNGLPGVGKTSLAIALVHDPEIRAYFSDGVLWAGLGPTPNPAGLLSRWAGLFGISETQFAELDEDQKRQALRTAIGTRSMLLVLDDVWRLEDALALHVGGHKCAYVLTTRFPGIATQMAVGNAMMIEELNEEQSMHLLRQLAPEVVDREETKVRELAHAVGGLPLALMLLGNYLRKQAYHLSARRAAAALDRLSSVNERFKISEPHLQAGAHPSLPSSMAISLSSIIEVTGHFLTSAAHETLYMLSVFPPKPASFSEEAALAVAVCTTQELDELVDAGLLVYQGTDRYRLHQIIADYARLHLDEQTEQLVIRRLLVYVQKYIEQHAEEYELLEREIALILYALDKAVTSEALQVQVVPLVCAAVPFLFLYGYNQEAQQCLDYAYELATDSQNLVCIALDEVGNLALARGNTDSALLAFQEMQRLCPQDDAEVQALSMFGLGRVYEQLGEYELAQSFGEQSLALLQQNELLQHIEHVQTWYASLVQ